MGRLAVCGSPYHPIRSCLECHRLDMKRRRARNPAKRQAGFKGPECLECGGINSRVAETGYTDDGQRIRRRECRDCGQTCASVEVYIDPERTSFWKLNGKRIREKRENDYTRRGKGVFRAPVKWRTPDRLEITVRIIPGAERERAA